METATCAKCDCPIILLWQSDGRRYNRVERRTLCVSCRPQPLAHPCSVKGCCGIARSEQGAQICAACNRISHRLANNSSYERHREERLAQRRQRRREQGEAIRAAERARYALKKSKLKEQSCSTSDS